MSETVRMSLICECNCKGNTVDIVFEKYVEKNQVKYPYVRYYCRPRKKYYVDIYSKLALWMFFKILCRYILRNVGCECVFLSALAPIFGWLKYSLLRKKRTLLSLCFVKRNTEVASKGKKTSSSLNGAYFKCPFFFSMYVW